MKNLLFLLFLISFNLNAQYKFTPADTYYLDVNLSKLVFKEINDFRSKINRKPYVWSDFWYKSANRWSEHLAKTSTWGHCNFENFNGQEMIVCIQVGPGTINYDSVTKEAVKQWYESPFHQFSIVCPLMQKPGDHAIGLRNNVMVNMYVSKYLGISAYVYDLGEKYNHYKTVCIVWQSGYFIDKDEPISKYSQTITDPLE
jgi:hypothetical protein